VVVCVDVERPESTDGGDAVERVDEEPLMFQGAPPAEIAPWSSWG
jgi:hypothetical protein